MTRADSNEIYHCKELPFNNCFCGRVDQQKTF